MPWLGDHENERTENNYSSNDEQDSIETNDEEESGYSNQPTNPPSNSIQNANETDTLPTDDVLDEHQFSFNLSIDLNAIDPLNLSKSTDNLEQTADPVEANQTDGENRNCYRSLESGASSETNLPIENIVVNQNDVLANQSTDKNTTVSDPLANNNTVKEEVVPLYDVHNNNCEEINHLLDEPEVHCFEDGMEMIVSVGGIPKPLACTADKVIKRENDPISGSFPYNITVSTLAIFMNFGVMVLFIKKHIATFLETRTRIQNRKQIH